MKKQFLLFFICMPAHAFTLVQPAQQTPQQQKDFASQFSNGAQGKLKEEIFLNEQFTGGLYLVRIKMDDAFFTQPLIVQR